MSYQKQWRQIWTGKLYGRYQYENWDKVEKEDKDLVRILDQHDGSHAIRTENGQLFDYWYNSAENPKNKSRKPQVTRRVPEGWQPNNQGTQSTIQTTTENQQPTFEEKLDIYKRDLNEILYLLKEVVRRLGGDPDKPPEIQRASGDDYKADHGNEKTGPAAGMGWDTFNAQKPNPYPEIEEKSAHDEDDGLPQAETSSGVPEIDTIAGPESVE
jgi:hypothetical protein